MTAATLSPQAPGAGTSSLRRRDFQRLTQEGRRATGEWIGVFASPRPDLVTRAGFTAGRRVGGAVRRNRARRLMREAWRAVAGRVEGGHDLVFVARAGIDRQKTPGVIDELESLLRGLEVIGP